MSIFFGLPEDFKSRLYKEIFDLAYHSGGAFTHDEIYEMPSLNRRYYLNLLVKQKEQERDTFKQKNSRIPELSTLNFSKKKP